MHTKEQAEKWAKKTLAMMNGKGWKLRIWENLGWHYCVENKNGLCVSPSVGNEYFASLNEDCCGDLGVWHFGTKIFKNPNDAVNEKLKDARKVVDELNAMVTKAENDMAMK